ncbi:hypothetical protein [Lentilactobacillus sp. SPB1-3]|uniref:Uncharacterized protein n=1 Tax=Lentilactobacillus terminaliae TaxID=3003483 RepID=A0ACD5DGS4_9LACO|nr:hypothetical protein [Lentilactobacillus sp. SPB1-3]MCZ0977072.1 hypothetical protein [Lentilactobacillus sp. SPB1-3]
MQAKSLLYSLSLTSISMVLFVAKKLGDNKKHQALMRSLQNRLINKVKPTIDDSNLTFLGSWFEQNSNNGKQAFHFGLDYEDNSANVLIHEYYADQSGVITSHQVTMN